MSTESFSGHASYDQWQDLISTPPDFSVPFRCSSVERLLSASQELAEFHAPKELEGNVTSLFEDGAPPKIAVQHEAHPRSTQFGDHRVRISGIRPDRTIEDIEEVVRKFGECESLEVQSGTAIVNFWDITAAFAICASLISDRGQPWTINFHPITEAMTRTNPPNNGTLVLFHLKPGVSDEQIIDWFSKYGEIRELRRSPVKDNPRFLEFFDLRSAQTAKDEANGKVVLGSKLSIEFSLPGGSRKCPQVPEVDRRHVPTLSIVRPARTDDHP